MKRIQHIKLYFKQGSSDKIYEVDLCENYSSNIERYFVHFRYGRRGKNLRNGTKTPEACDFKTAQKLFDRLVDSKIKRGYCKKEKTSKKMPSQTHTSSYKKIGQSLDSIGQHIIKMLNNDDCCDRSRLLWRLGEIGDKKNIPTLQAYLSDGHYLEEKSWFDDYSIIWALGRIGNSSGMSSVNRRLDSSNPVISHLAYEVKLLLESKDEQYRLLSEEKAYLSDYLPLISKPLLNTQALSTSIFDYLTHDSTEPIDHTVSKKKVYDSNTVNKILELLYRQTLNDQEIKKSLIDVLARIPFKKAYFPSIRHIFKMAELRLDHEMFALLTYRMEINPFIVHDEWSSVYEENEYYSRDSPYSHETRNYFRRRSWRSIKRLGELKDSRYVFMASAILLQMSDKDAGQEKSSNAYEYGEIVGTNVYPIYSGFLAFNHILYGNSSVFRLSKNRLIWLKNGVHDPLVREETFPELWDKNPSILLHILKNSRCKLVHDFALTILNDHPLFCSEISLSDWIELLCVLYPRTQQFAFNGVQTYLQKKSLQSFQETIILGLIHSSLFEAHQLVIEHIERYFDAGIASNNTMIALIITPHDILKEWFHKRSIDFCFDDKQTRQLTQEILSMSLKSSLLTMIESQLILDFLEKHLKQYVMTLESLLIESFIRHPSIVIQHLGVGLLLMNEMPFEAIDSEWITLIASSSNENIRVMGIDLLKKQSLKTLSLQGNKIADLFYFGSALERKSAMKLAQSTCLKSREFTQTLIKALINFAFRAEVNEGQHDDLHRFFMHIIADQKENFDPLLLWRLIHAQSKAAQKIGSEILKTIAPNVFSITQWAALAKNSQQSVRNWSLEAYENHIDQIKKEAKSALLILDTPWENTRQIAFDFFNAHFNVSDWEPKLILFICDNPRDDVQAFGRKILKRFFKVEQGEYYLLRLSQHPSQRVQLMASDFLSEYAADNPNHLFKLRHYFLTVLSMVHRGRICKNRILDFLLQEAKKNPSVAQWVAELFSRQSLTSIIHDHAFILQAMLTLKKYYPELDLPLNTIEKPVWQKVKGV
jgi:predicted DNA-binding WGR domain protein